MPARPDQFPKIARARASAASVKEFFGALEVRSEKFAESQDEFIEQIRRYREIKERKPVKVSDRQKRTLARFERDGLLAERDIARNVEQMDDSALLRLMLVSLNQQIESDENMFSAYPQELQPTARQLIDFQRKTKLMTEDFAASFNSQN